MPIRIAKADGTTQEFKREKLLNSLHRSGADSATAEHIATDIEGELRSGITTGEIYAKAFAHLRKHRRGVAARYSLKRAILDFGPSGFPFESYLAEIFRAEGYTAKVDQMIQGSCVQHEVDVVLTRGGETVYVEAKFHNAAGFKTDLKTALYVKARIDDIAAAGLPREEKRKKGLLVTNTKFTSHAVKYATCQGLDLLGWEYPKGKTLQDRIEAAGVYPITALTTLNRREKTALLQERMVLCNSLGKHTDALSRAGISGRRADQALDEASILCVPGGAV